VRSITLSFILIIVQLLFQSCLAKDKVEWNDFIPVRSKKVWVNDALLERKVNIDWPVFSKEVLTLNGTQIVLEGYYFSFQALDLGNFELMENGTPSYKTIQMIACCPKFTTTICGQAQFLQHEFCVIPDLGDSKPKQAEKIKVQGILRLNLKGEDENLIRLENAIRI